MDCSSYWRNIDRLRRELVLSRASWGRGAGRDGKMRALSRNCAPRQPARALRSGEGGKFESRMIYKIIGYCGYDCADAMKIRNRWQRVNWSHRRRGDCFSTAIQFHHAPGQCTCAFSGVARRACLLSLVSLLAELLPDGAPPQPERNRPGFARPLATTIRFVEPGGTAR